MNLFDGSVSLISLWNPATDVRIRYRYTGMFNLWFPHKKGPDAALWDKVVCRRYPWYHASLVAWGDKQLCFEFRVFPRARHAFVQVYRCSLISYWISESDWLPQIFRFVNDALIISPLRLSSLNSNTLLCEPQKAKRRNDARLCRCEMKESFSRGCTEVWRLCTIFFLVHFKL